MNVAQELVYTVVCALFRPHIMSLTADTSLAITARQLSCFNHHLSVYFCTTE